MCYGDSGLQVYLLVALQLHMNLPVHLFLLLDVTCDWCETVIKLIKDEIADSSVDVSQQRIQLVYMQWYSFELI